MESSAPFFRAEPSDPSYVARVMRHAAANRVPVPAVQEVTDTAVVMERIDGPTMRDVLVASPWRTLWHARTLARLQHRLAQVAAPDWMLAGGADQRRAHSVLHLDLHPDNVIISPRRGPVIVGWERAAGGPAGFDAAMTYVALCTVDAPTPRDHIRQQVLARSFRRVRGPALIDPFVVAACDHRLADRTTPPDERVAVAALRTAHLESHD